MVNDANRDRILFINPVGTTNSPVTTVQGIRFQNAYLSSDPYGGAAICAGGGSAESLTVTNCAFDNNTLPANAYGGAAVCLQVRGNLTIDNSTFTNNVSNDADGGAVLFIVFGSTLGNGYGTLSVTNSIFTGNSVNVPGASTSNGGALAFAGQGGNTPFSATINNNTFVNNTADGLGGAISANNGPNVTTAQIHFNRFVNNTASVSALSSGLHFVESSGSVNAENNWWGCNTNPVSGASTAPCNQAGGDVAGGGALDANPWLQLRTTAVPNTICNSTPTTLGNTSTVTTSFLNNSDGTAISVANLTRVIGLPVTWTSALGNLSAQQTTVQAAGTATALFTSNGTAGGATTNAQVDNVPAGETSPARASITVNTTSIAPTGATGTTTICRGSGTTLTVTGGLKGSGASTQWFTGSCGGTLIFTGDALAVSPTTTTTYFVRYNGTCNATTCAMVTVTVNDPSVAPTGITGTTTICNPGSTTLTATGGTLGTGANYQWGTGAVVGTSPIGGATNASLMVSPTTTTTYWVRIENTNAPCGANTGGLTQVVTVNQPPAITSGNSTTFTAGSNGNIQMTASGSPAPMFSFSGALPTGVTLSSAGLLSGTPAPGTGGTYPIAVTATNICSPAAMQNFTLTVNEAPAITSANATTFVVGTNGSFNLTASGFPAPTFSTASALPVGVTLSAAGLLSGTPGPGTGGVYNLVLTANNGIGSPDSQNFTLTVNEAPAITSANSTAFTVGASGNFQLAASGFPASFTFTNTGNALPTGVTLSASGLLSGTPVAGTGGVYNLTFTASNGINPNATQSFTLTVNQTPAFTSANTATFTVGTNSSVNITANGFPSPSITVQSGTVPMSVAFTPGNGTATLAGTPNAGTGGIYNLVFAANNGFAFADKSETEGTVGATQNFTLTVNEAPSITSANSTAFTEGNFGTFTAAASGFPAPTFSTTDPLPNGVTLSASGVLSGTPVAGSAGNYPITITATNGVGSNAQQSFTLSVTAAVCSAPPSDAISWFAAEGNTKDLLGANDGSFVNTAAYAAGKVGQGFSFSGASYVTVPAASGSLNLTGSQVTIEGWINPIATAGAVYFGKTANGANDYLLLLDAGQLSAIIKAGGSEKIVRGFSDYPTNSVPLIPTPGQWTHLALTYDGALIKLYANGVQVGQDTKTGTIDGSGSPFNIGGRAGSLFFSGQIDEVDVFNRALGQSEVQAIYNASIAGKCLPPLQLTSAVSRKTHGIVGAFDIALPLTGEPGVECRSGGGNDDHSIVVTFSNGVVSGTANVTGGSLSGLPTFSGNQMTVNLTGVSNAQQVTVQLSSVTDAVGQTLPAGTVKMNVLLGDVNGNKAVTATDIGQVKANSGGSPVDGTNFRNDLNVDGSINTSDIGMVKTAAGTVIP